MKKTLAIGLLICALAAPASLFAQTQQPQERERPTDRIIRIIKLLIPVRSLGPEIVVPWPG